MNAQTGVRYGMVCFQFGSNGIDQAHQNDVHIRVIAQKTQCSGHSNMGAMIATHGIDCDSDIH
jgi:hypothetical protein